MPEIQLSTFIKAPLQRVFDLSRSIDLHKISTKRTNEKAISGITHGLINLNETVTWQAYHLFKTRIFTSVISKMTVPSYFCDEMTEGDFVSFKHDHYFVHKDFFDEAMCEGTLMTDIINFKSPLNIIGIIFNKVYLTRYLKKLLITRNECIKVYAESAEWQTILDNKIIPYHLNE